MRKRELEHLDESLIVSELKNNPTETIPDFIDYLNTKYNFNEHYTYIYQVIKRNDLWEFITKTKPHNTFDRLIENEQLKDILFTYSGFEIKLIDLLKIIQKETGKKYTKYSIKRLISYYNLEYITERQVKLQTQEDRLNYKQKSNIIRYCFTKNININRLSIKDLFHLYNTFQYEYLANVIFEIMNKNK